MKILMILLAALLLISSASAYICYQGIANKSTTLDGICELNYTGLYYYNLSSQEAFINWTKPSLEIIQINNVTFELKNYCEIKNYTLQSNCIINNTISIKINNSLNVKRVYCFNITGWYLMGENNANCGGSSRAMDHIFDNTKWYDGNWSTGTTVENATWATSNYYSENGDTIFEGALYYDLNKTALINDVNYTKIIRGGSIGIFNLNMTFDYTYYTSYNISLIYNGTSYSTTSSDSGNNKLFSKLLPLANVNSAINYSFYWNITLISADYNYLSNTLTYNQTVTPLSIDNCSSYTNKLFNFSLFDEKNQTKLTDGVNLQFYLSVYDSTKSNLISNISFSSNYSGTGICFNSNFTSTDNLILDGLIRYESTGHEPEYYNLRNIVLNDTTINRNITLYDILTAESTTFKLTLTGTSIEPLSDAIIYVNRKYVSEGVFKTVEAPLTDSKGAAVIHLVNNDMVYQLIAIKDNQIISSIELTPSCQVSPCTISMAKIDESGGVLGPINDYFAENIISSISYDKVTKNLTYTFVDTTATANYFRLVVSKVMYNQTTNTICDSYVYSMAGTIVCDLSNYEGDFVAKTYISRSPELTDKVFSFIVDSSVIEDLGIDIVFLNFCLIVIIVLCVAVISRGSPSSIILSIGISVLALRIIGIFPFSWIIVSSIELICIYLWRKVRS